MKTKTMHSVKLNPADNTVTINNMTFSMEIFEMFAKMAKDGDIFRFNHRAEYKGQITFILERVDKELKI